MHFTRLGFDWIMPNLRRASAQCHLGIFLHRFSDSSVNPFTRILIFFVSHKFSPNCIEKKKKKKAIQTSLNAHINLIVRKKRAMIHNRINNVEYLLLNAFQTPGVKKWPNKVP